MRTFFLLISLLIFTQGCAWAPSRLPAVPQDLTSKAQIPGMTGVRYVANGDITELIQAGIKSYGLEKQALGSQKELPPAVFLAISGGGDKGAFAAGLLNGWTETGTRPEFKLVTGISTGALIAPFAFLGSKYDAQLKKVYTTTSTNDVMRNRSFLEGILSDAMADNSPLLRLTRQSITLDMLNAIATEYRKGRFLLIATADIDARRPIIWDMGKLATYGNDKALDLFVKIMVASASIPGGFPPAMFDVEADGKKFQEMHVDGGIMAQVFAYPTSMKLDELGKKNGITRERKLYVIRNAQLNPDWAQVERKTLDIAARAVTSLIHSQGIGDIYRIYATAQRDGVDFNLGFIPASFKEPHREEFNRDYMCKLFTTGYNMALKGFPWSKAPPGFATTDAAASGKK